MQHTNIPLRFAKAFAEDAAGAFIREVPVPSQIGIQDGAASYTTGFPPDCFTPLSAGGIPPFGQDFNGVLFEMTSWDQWYQAGAPLTYNTDFSTAIGGYPKGATLSATIGSGRFWISQVDDNVTDPDAGGAGWTGYPAFVSPDMFGPIGVSAAADTAALAAAISFIGSSNEVLLIRQPMTINAGTTTFPANIQLRFVNGGSFTGAAGTEIFQFTTPVEAPLTRILYNCVPKFFFFAFVPVEWFGGVVYSTKGDAVSGADSSSAEQVAANSLVNGGEVLYQGGYYRHNAVVRVNETLNPSAASFSIRFRGKGRRATTIVLMGATTSGFSFVGTSGSYLFLPEVSGIGFQRSTTGTGGIAIEMLYANTPTVSDVFSDASLIGLSIVNAPGLYAFDVVVSASIAGSSGFSISGNNNSAIFERCSSSGYNPTVAVGSAAFLISGTYVGDMTFKSCSSSFNAIGFNVDCSITTYLNNLIFDQCTVDAMNIAGYNIAGGNSLADANSVRITGGWVNPVAGALGTPTYCVLIQNTDGVEVDGVQFYKGNASFSYGVNALSSSGLTLTDLQVSGVTNGISLTDCAFSSITSCRFNNPSGLNANNQLYVLRGSEIVANSNVFLGYGNHAIEIDHCSLFTGFGNSCSGTPNFNTTFSQISPTGTNFTTGNNPGF